MAVPPSRGKPNYAFKTPKKVMLEQVNEQPEEERQQIEHIRSPQSVPSPLSIGSVDDLISSPGNLLGSPPSFTSREYIGGLNSQGDSLRSDLSSLSSPATPPTPSPQSRSCYPLSPKQRAKNYFPEKGIGKDIKNAVQSDTCRNNEQKQWREENLSTTSGPSLSAQPHSSQESPGSNVWNPALSKQYSTGLQDSDGANKEGGGQKPATSGHPQMPSGSGMGFEAFMNPTALAGLSPSIASHVASLAQASAVLLASGNPKEVIKDLAKLFGVTASQGEDQTPEDNSAKSQSKLPEKSDVQSDCGDKHVSKQAKQSLTEVKGSGNAAEQPCTPTIGESQRQLTPYDCNLQSNRPVEEKDGMQRGEKQLQTYQTSKIPVQHGHDPVPDMTMAQYQAHGMGNPTLRRKSNPMPALIRMPYGQNNVPPFDHNRPFQFTAGNFHNPCVPPVRHPHFQETQSKTIHGPPHTPLGMNINPNISYQGKESRGHPEQKFGFGGHDPSHGSVQKNQGDIIFRNRLSSDGPHVLPHNRISPAFQQQYNFENQDNVVLNHGSSDSGHSHGANTGKDSFIAANTGHTQNPSFRCQSGLDIQSGMLTRPPNPEGFQPGHRRYSETNTCTGFPPNRINPAFPAAHKHRSPSHSDVHPIHSIPPNVPPNLGNTHSSDVHSTRSQTEPSRELVGLSQSSKNSNISSSSCKSPRTCTASINDQSRDLRPNSQFGEVSSSKDALMDPIKQEVDWPLDGYHQTTSSGPRSTEQLQTVRRPSGDEGAGPGDAKVPRRPSITISNRPSFHLGNDIELVEMDTIEVEDGTKGEEGVSQSGTPTGSAPQLDCRMCQVCGDIAAGFHCGAYVCEACKKFFVRCYKQDASDKFVCTKNKSCHVSKETRTQCQFCRFHKCLHIGMYKPGTGPGASIASEISFIPCKVCGAPSSGYHFGAITCEGCKGFFRRTVKEREGMRYTCNRNGDCDITTSTRNICKYCRYHKCLSVGMKPDGSRIGRQPNSIKHATMLELQQIKAEKGFLHPKSETDTDDITITEEGELPSSKVDVVINPMAEKPRMFEEFLDTLKKTAVELQPILVRAAGAVTLQPSMAAGEVWQAVMANFGQCAMATLKFAKKIPGFRKLPIDQQISMVQTSMYPIVLIMMSTLYDLETDSYNYFHLAQEEIDVIMGYFPPFKVLLGHFSTFGKVLKVMDLDELEVALLAALFMLRDVEEDPDSPSLQQTVMEALEEYCCQKYGSTTNRHGHILLRLGDLAKVNMQHQNAVMKLMIENPTLEIPQLYKETFIND